MRKALGSIFTTLWLLAVIANGILVLYVEWRIIRQDFFLVFMPQTHLMAAIDLLRQPLFWILTPLILLFYFLAQAFDADRTESP